MAPRNFGDRAPNIVVEDTCLLLIDHQSGLFQLVKDVPLPQLRANVTVLARAATASKIPVITTASVPQGPNGPVIPEIERAAPHVQYVARRGEINAWLNPDFVAAVKKTGRKTLIIAGTLTNVCLAFPAVSAVNDGYRVFAVFDASGASSVEAAELTMARLLQAGVVPIDTMGAVAELQETWARPDAAEWANIYAQMLPHYGLLMESYEKAREVTVAQERFDSDSPSTH